MALHGTAWHRMALHGTAWHCMAPWDATPGDAISLEARIANSVFPDATSLAQMCRSSPTFGATDSATDSDAGQGLW